MRIAKKMIKKEALKEAQKILDNEKNIDKAVDAFFSNINWGMIVGFLIRKTMGLLK